MTKTDLVKKGIDSEHIYEIKLYLDDLVECKFDDEKEFFQDYCYYYDEKEMLDEHSIHYWINGTNGKALDVIVWLERRE